jgi:hypothetical protein
VNFPITFVRGDVLDDTFISIDKTLAPTSKAEESIVYPSLSSLDLSGTLNPLLGKISAIHASAFFHLFDEEKQIIVARKLAALLSPEPGSIIFGSHGGSRVKGVKSVNIQGIAVTGFCHSAETFKELWEKEIFKNGEAVCEAMINDYGQDRLLLIWIVRRV